MFIIMKLITIILLKEHANEKQSRKKRRHRLATLFSSQSDLKTTFEDIRGLNVSQGRKIGIDVDR